MTNLYNMIGSASEAHYVNDMEFFVIANGQEITLPYTMYDTNLTVVRTIGGATITASPTTFELVKDYDSLSVAKLIDPNFSANLVNKIKILMSGATIGAGFAIQVRGYAFDTPYEDLVDETGLGPVPTPGLMQHILQELAFITQSRLDPSENMALLLQGNSPKDYDGTGQAEANYVRNEAHYVNVHTNQCVIVPSAGDFYAHDVVVQYTQSAQGGATNQILQLGIDYDLTALRMDKIMASACPNPVYGRIVVKAAIMGTVLLSYRAVGGQTTNAHFAQLASAINGMATYIQSSGILTEANLHRSVGFANLQNRIRALEAQSGIFPQKQYTFTVANDNFNWYTIGTVGFNSSGAPVPYGQYCINIDIPDHKTAYMAIISLNLNNPLQVFNVETVTSVGSPVAGTVSDFINFDQIDATIQEQRIINIGDPSDHATFKGGLLQIGYRGTAGAGFYPIVTNRSHVVDGLALYEPGSGVSTAQNDNVLIKDTVWSSTNDVHKQSRHVLAHTSGELLWQGAISLNSAAVTSMDLDSIWNGEPLDLGAVRAIDIVIKDRFTKSIILVRGEHSGDTELIGGSLVFDATDTCVIRYVIFYTESNELAITVDADLGAHSKALERYELHRLVLKF